MKLPLLISLVLTAAPEQGHLSRLSIEDLLSCAGDASRCEESEWDLASELGRRLDTAALAARLRRASGAPRRVLVFALYVRPATPEVAQLMRQLSHDADAELAYYALNYRAKLCERSALAELTATPFAPRAACQQWATTVDLVGKCHYAPGAAFLVDSLDHGCLNVVLAAERGLRMLFPDAPASFASAEDAQAYFRRRLQGGR